MGSKIKGYIVTGYYTPYYPLANAIGIEIGPVTEYVFGRNKTDAQNEWDRKVLPRGTYFKEIKREIKRIML